jgi:hypothetical protein
MVLSVKPHVKFSSVGGKGMDEGRRRRAKGGDRTACLDPLSPPTTVSLAGLGLTDQGHVPRFVQTGTTFPYMLWVPLISLHLALLV